MLVTMVRYTRYYVNQSGGSEIGPDYRASNRMRRDDGIGSLSECSSVLLNLLYLGAKAVGKEVLKSGSNIITDILYLYTFITQHAPLH